MENSKLRIAICFYGQVRFYEGLNGIYEELNTKYPNIQFDFFLSTWRDIDRRKIKLKFRKERQFHHDQVTKNWQIGNTQKMAFLFSNAVRLKQEYELEQDFSYDWVFMTRPDIIYDFNKFVEHLDNLRNHKFKRHFVGVMDLPVKDDEGHNKITSDYGFLFSSEAADIHGSIYNFFFLQKRYKDIKEPTYREGGHWIHSYYFIFNNFEMYHLQMSSLLVRPNRDLDTIVKHIDDPYLISYVANNAHTWKLIDGQTIEKDGKRLSFKGRLI